MEFQKYTTIETLFYKIDVEYKFGTNEKFHSCQYKRVMESRADPISTSKVSPKIATTFEYRRKLADAILSKHPDRFPLIVEINNAGNLARRKIKIKQHKFLVPNDATVGSFISTFTRGNFLDGIGEHEAIFFFFGHGNICPITKLMGDLYKTYQEDDGFLYCKVDIESTFG